MVFILTILYFILLHHPILTLANDSPSPYTYSHVDNSIDYNNLAGRGPESRKMLSYFGRGNTIATGVIIVITLLNIVVYKLRQLYEENLGEELNISSSSSSSSSSLVSDQLCRRFSLREILCATNNFDDSLVIGKGGFGKVYKGVIDNGLTSVAIKRLHPMSKQGAPEFWTEIRMLSKFRHSHLVSLIGYCDINNEMILVYEYMVNGTLADHMHKISKDGDKSSLSWVQRLKICIGAARGLDYLHTGTCIQHRVIHRDVKSANILLNENWAAKISDFGLSKIGPADQTCTHISTINVKGTFGYLDPEYFLTRRFTRKSDVYAFGVVLFEVLCERRAVDLSLDEEQRGLAQWAQQCIKEGRVEKLIGPGLKWQIWPNSLMEFVKIADQCLHNRPKKRPTMAEVMVRLEFALSTQVSTDSSVIEGDIFNTGRNFDNQQNADSYPDAMQIDEIDGTTQVSDSSNRKSLKGDIFNTGRNFDKQENADSYPDDVQIDEIDGTTQVSNSSNGKSLKKPMMTFIRKVQMFFSVTTPEGYTDAKPSGNAKSNSNIGDNSTLTNKDGGVVFKVPSSGKIVIPNLKLFTFTELKSATRNFRLDMLLGEGGFGKVFKGWVDEKTYAPSKSGVGKAVAVKRLKPTSFQGYKEGLSEVEFLGKFSHPNFVKLLGYCWEGAEFLLVYEYMQNGSLESHLFGNLLVFEPPPWVTRLKVAIGAAQGLAFLHSTDVILRSFKTSNILLDGDFNAKLTDFDLARTGPANGSTHISTAVLGTFGYAAPEYVATGHLCVKSDVYGFGVVLLEILTGQAAYDYKRGSEKRNLVKWALPFLSHKRNLKKIIDPRLEHNYPLKGALKLAALVGQCLQRRPGDRPSMNEVLETLEQINNI